MHACLTVCACETLTWPFCQPPGPCEEIKLPFDNYKEVSVISLFGPKFLLNNSEFTPGFQGMS